MRDHPPLGHPGGDAEDSWSESLYGQDDRDPGRSYVGDGAQYFQTGSRDVRFACPACQSPRTRPRHLARRIGGAIGATAGATGAIAIALSGAEAGATAGLIAGLIAGPVGSACGGIAGAILAGLVAGTAGCATGAACGEAIDQKVLNNWQCTACGHTFTASSR
jgi:hypothetical protein